MDKTLDDLCDKLFRDPDYFDKENWKVVPCRIFDAIGHEIFQVTHCNTRTGFVERFLLDENGKFVVEDGELVLVTEVRKSPLVIVGLE